MLANGAITSKEGKAGIRKGGADVWKTRKRMRERKRERENERRGERERKSTIVAGKTNGSLE